MWTYWTYQVGSGHLCTQKAWPPSTLGGQAVPHIEVMRSNYLEGVKEPLQVPVCC